MTVFSSLNIPPLPQNYSFKKQLSTVFGEIIRLPLLPSAANKIATVINTLSEICVSTPRPVVRRSLRTGRASRAGLVNNA